MSPSSLASSLYSLTCRFCFKDLCIYLFEKSCMCMLHCFLYHCHFFFGGGLSLWKNLCNTIILQLCFVHLFVPSGNWQALNIICGLVVMEFAYVLLFDLENLLFLFLFFVFLGYCCWLCRSMSKTTVSFFFFAPKNIAGHQLDYVHLFTLNRVFLQGHSKSATPSWRIQPMCVSGLGLKIKIIALFSLFLLLFMGPTALFGTIHRSYCTISINFYPYLQYSQQQFFSFSKISGIQTHPIYGTPQVTCVVICISNPWSKLS